MVGPTVLKCGPSAFRFRLRAALLQLLPCRAGETSAFLVLALLASTNTKKEGRCSRLPSFFCFNKLCLPDLNLASCNSFSHSMMLHDTIRKRAIHDRLPRATIDPHHLRTPRRAFLSESKKASINTQRQSTVVF